MPKPETSMLLQIVSCNNVCYYYTMYEQIRDIYMTTECLVDN